MEGISSRQGGHQVAQKFTKTTWPRASASVRGLPSAVQPRTGGAATGRATGVTSKAFSATRAACRGASTHSCQPVHAAAATTKRATAAMAAGLPFPLCLGVCGSAAFMRRRS